MGYNRFDDARPTNSSVPRGALARIDLVRRVAPLAGAEPPAYQPGWSPSRTNPDDSGQTNSIA